MGKYQKCKILSREIDDKLQPDYKKMCTFNPFDYGKLVINYYLITVN